MVGAGEHQTGAHETFIQVEQLQRPLCGKSRPHFFRGVATVGRYSFLMCINLLDRFAHAWPPSVGNQHVAPRWVASCAGGGKAVQHHRTRCRGVWAEGLSAAARPAEDGAGLGLRHRGHWHAHHARAGWSGHEQVIYSQLCFQVLQSYHSMHLPFLARMTRLSCHVIAAGMRCSLVRIDKMLSAYPSHCSGRRGHCNAGRLSTPGSCKRLWLRASQLPVGEWIMLRCAHGGHLKIQNYIRSCWNTGMQVNS